MQNASFRTQHIAMLLKYGGISFIAGAVSHGVFSGTRSLVTAGIGIIAFVLGTLLEYRSKDKTDQTSLINALIFGTVLSIGLGFFTGSLQHFPDSPWRSLWVVPLGFALSLVALGFLNRDTLTSASKRYALSSFIVVAASSIAAYSYFSQNPTAHDHHQSGHSDQHESTQQASDDHHDHAAHAHGDHGANLAVIGKPATADQVQRTVHITMDDAMRFTPDTLQVQPNEVVKLVITNQGKLKHELTLGEIADLQAHAKAMLANPNMVHSDPNTVSLNAGETGEIIWQFNQAGTVDFACLQPGHYEAGMKGVIHIAHAP